MVLGNLHFRTPPYDFSAFFKFPNVFFSPATVYRIHVGHQVQPAPNVRWGGMSCNGSSGPLFLVNCGNQRQTVLESLVRFLHCKQLSIFFFGICFQEIEFMSTRVRYSKALDGTDYIPGCIGRGLSEIPTSRILRSFDFFFSGDFSRPKGSKRPKMWSFLELRSEQHPGFRLPKCHHPDVVHRSSDREAWAGSIQQIQNDWRKFRSQNSDNMDRWKAEQGSGREKRKIRRKKTRRERVRCRCEKR